MKFVTWKAYHLESRLIIDKYIDLAKKYVEEKGYTFIVCEDEESIKREISDADVFFIPPACIGSDELLCGSDGWRSIIRR